MSKVDTEENLPSSGGGDYLVTPEDYIVEIYEIGVCKTNPIKGSGKANKVWDKAGNEILFKSNKPVILNVGVGKNKKNLVLNQPSLGVYNYNYILLRKAIKIKVVANFKSGEKFYSKSNGKGDAINLNDNYSGFTENIVNFNFNDKAWDTNDSNVVDPGSSSYFNDATNKVEGLLLKADKKTKSMSNSETEFILAVYDSTNTPLSVIQNGGFNITFASSNSAEMSCSDWENAIKLKSYLISNKNVNIVADGGNKYVFNDASVYNSELRYILKNGTYILKNISSGHPFALLNNGKTANITYECVSNVNSPIIIKVNGGATSESNGDFYVFKDENDNIINIGNGTFRFMRGKTYKFEADDISTDHPFKIWMGGPGGSFVNDNNGVNTGITGSTDSITITIPANHSTNEGHLYYQCAQHSAMKKNLSLFYKNVSGTTNDASYDFYYGDVSITVTGDFLAVSVYCYYHGYMGGESLFEYPKELIQFNSLPPKYSTISK